MNYYVRLTTQDAEGERIASVFIYPHPEPPFAPVGWEVHAFSTLEEAQTFARGAATYVEYAR